MKKVEGLLREIRGKEAAQQRAIDPERITLGWAMKVHRLLGRGEEMHFPRFLAFKSQDGKCLAVKTSNGVTGFFAASDLGYSVGEDRPTWVDECLNN